MPDDTAATVAAPPAVPAYEYADLGLDLIAASPTNPRKHFDQAALAELAGSIASKGLIEPIVVRRRRGRGTEFEIVAGERRWRAARLAGLGAISAKIVELDDKQVLELQLIENLQREGLHPIEEAEGYGELRRRHGYSPEDIAAKINRSRTYVFNRLKLLDLCAAARKLALDGALDASVAERLARVPGDKLQMQAAKEILDRQMTARAAIAHLQERYTLRLNDAPWKLDDAELLPAAGACTSCPKRSGAQPELFADISGANVCTDPTCFAAKREAFDLRRLAAARAAGQVVVDGKAARKIKPERWSELRGYVDLDAHCHDVPGNKTFRELFRKDAPPTALFVDPHDGKIREVLRDDEVQRQLKTRGLRDSNARRAQSADDYNAQQKKAEQQAKLASQVRRAIWLAVRDKIAAAPGLEDMRMVALGYYEDIWHEFRKDLCRMWNWDPNKKDFIGTLLANLDGRQLAQFACDCALVKSVRVSPWQERDRHTDALLAAAKRHGVDAAAIEREIRAADKRKAVPEKKR